MFLDDINNPSAILSYFIIFYYSSRTSQVHGCSVPFPPKDLTHSYLYSKWSLSFGQHASLCRMNTWTDRVKMSFTTQMYVENVRLSHFNTFTHLMLQSNKCFRFSFISLQVVLFWERLRFNRLLWTHLHVLQVFIKWIWIQFLSLP